MKTANRSPADRLQQAVALHRSGHLSQARALYEEILVAQPRHVDALHLLGVICIQAREPRRALQLLEQAIAVHPHSAAIHCNHGSALEALGQPATALDSFNRAIAIDPKHVEAHFNRGNVLCTLGRHELALVSYDLALALRPQLTDAHFNRGNALRRLERFYEAKASYEAVIALKPDHAEAYLSRGIVLKALQQLDAALASYDAALAIKPDYADAHSNRGNVLKQLARAEAALASYDRAIAARPDFAEAHFNRGVVLHELGRFPEAIASYDSAVRVRPDYVEAHSNRGNALTELNLLPEALASYETAIALNQDYAPAHFNAAVARLLSGDFARGWSEYEWRWKNEAGSVINERREFAEPLWLGASSPAGKTILLYGEQGLGDTLQFCRYARCLADLNARVVLEVREPLAGLLSSLAGVSELIVKGNAPPPFDVHCPLMSLPLAFHTTLADIPHAAGYLTADAIKIDQWRARLGPASRPRVGLAWSGNPSQKNDHKRSLPLAAWIPHLPTGVDYFCLQTALRDADRSTLESTSNIHYFGDELDFEQAAALCICLDLVISVDTSLAHLSAALGRPTWILLPFSPDWRWLLDRDDSPWYRSATLYRQPAIGDWTPVFERVAADLRGLGSARLDAAPLDTSVHGSAGLGSTGLGSTGLGSTASVSADHSSTTLGSPAVDLTGLDS